MIPEADIKFTPNVQLTLKTRRSAEINFRLIQQRKNEISTRFRDDKFNYEMPSRWKVDFHQEEEEEKRAFSEVLILKLIHSRYLPWK